MIRGWSGIDYQKQPVVFQNHLRHLSNSDRGDSTKKKFNRFFKCLHEPAINHQEQSLSTPMHFSAGGFGVLKLPLFQCSEPLGYLMHAQLA